MAFLSKKYFLLLFVILLFPTFSWTQNSILIFNEDFETVNYSFMADSSFGLPQGINSWVVNNEYNGNGIYPNTTSQTNTVSGTIGNPGGYYLHISDTTQITNVSNANYDTQNSSDHFYVLDRSFCTLGFDSIEFSFFYLCFFLFVHSSGNFSLSVPYIILFVNSLCSSSECLKDLSE